MTTTKKICRTGQSLKTKSKKCLQSFRKIQPSTVTVNKSDYAQQLLRWGSHATCIEHKGLHFQHWTNHQFVLIINRENNTWTKHLWGCFNRNKAKSTYWLELLGCNNRPFRDMQYICWSYFMVHLWWTLKLKLLHFVSAWPKLFETKGKEQER